MTQPIAVEDSRSGHERYTLAQALCGNPTPSLDLVAELKELCFHIFLRALRQDGQTMLQNLSRYTLDETILMVCQFIDEHLSESLPMDRLAALACLSPPQLTRRFRQALAQSPARWIRERRITQAAHMLVIGHDSIDAIASRTVDSLIAFNLAGALARYLVSAQAATVTNMVLSTVQQHFIISSVVIP